MRLRTALCVLPLLAALPGCSDDDAVPAVPALAATPVVEPVTGPVVQSELQRAVAAMEAHRSAEGTYTRDPNSLVEHGFVSGEVLVFVPYADEDRYCVEATSSTDTRLVFSASDTAPEPRRGGCPED